MNHFQVNHIGACVIVALSIACAPANSSKQGAETSATTLKDTTRVSTAVAAKDSDGIKADLARIQGNPAAPVWVIEVSDFQCPFCKLWHDTTYAALRDEFVRTGKVRLAYVNFPLAQHQYAWPAAESAMCAGAQGKFWEMHDALYDNQKEWSDSMEPRVQFDSYATRLGLDVQRFKADMDRQDLTDRIKADMQRGNTLNVRGTPTLYLNGRELMPGKLVTEEDLRREIDATLGTSGK
jgi:protein-disulfide isomerase